MEDRLRELGVEALDRLDRAADEVVAERDLAEQPAGVGEVDRQRVVVVGLRLADVVQERAGDRHIAVDAREGGRGGAHRLGDRDRVVEEPVAVGLVVVLRRRRDAKAPPDPRLGGEDAVEQLRAAAGSGSCPAARAASSSSASAETGGPSARSSSVYSSSRGGADRADRDLRPVLRMNREPPLDEDDRAGRGAGEALVDLLPGHRLDRAAAVGEDQAQEVVAVAARASFALADDEGGRDRVALGELADRACGRPGSAAGAASAGPARASICPCTLIDLNLDREPDGRDPLRLAS